MCLSYFVVVNGLDSALFHLLKLQVPEQFLGPVNVGADLVLELSVFFLPDAQG